MKLSRVASSVVVIVLIVLLSVSRQGELRGSTAVRLSRGLNATLIRTGISLASTSAPVPLLGHSASVSSVRGQVFLKRPGSRVFSVLVGTTLVPVGTTVNATAGVVRVTTATSLLGGLQSALFYSGQFRLTQAQSGSTTLRLNAPLDCAAVHSGDLRDSKVAARRFARTLRGQGQGSLPSSGRYAAATVMGRNG